MGTYANLFAEKTAKIPENKKEEFVRRVEKVFQSGGMMERDFIRMYGREVPVLRKAKMRGDGMNFYYNYFEDECWENAGFSVGNEHVWSEKIGCDCFHKAVVAAYVLEEMFTEGAAVATVNGNPVTSWEYVGWLNSLFGEKNHIKNYDAWKLFEAMHDSGDYAVENFCWNGFGNKSGGFVGACEIYAVKEGTENLLQHPPYEVLESGSEKNEWEKSIFLQMKMGIDYLKKYKAAHFESDEEQVEEIISTFRRVYKLEKNLKKR